MTVLVSRMLSVLIVLMAAVAGCKAVHANHFILCGDVKCLDDATTTDDFGSPGVPAQGAWAIGPRMHFPRAQHTATLLADGRVLFIGGSAGTDIDVEFAPTYPELFDPDGGSLTFDLQGADVRAARSDHTATLLNDGRILVVGGWRYGQGGHSSSLYDPRTQTWSDSGPLNDDRFEHAALLLPNGRVLVLGGAPIEANDFSRRPEIFDPATLTWTPTRTRPGLGLDRMGHTMTLLTNGKVLVVGGLHPSVLAGDETLDTDSPSDVSIFDPDTGEWTAATSTTEGRLYHTATLLANGDVLVAGGALSSSAEIYHPASGNWTSAGTLISSRARHTATLLADGRVLLAGGERNSADAMGRVNSLVAVELYDPTANRWSSVANMNQGRAQQTATLLRDGSVLIAGGRTFVHLLDWGNATNVERFIPAQPLP